MTELGLSDLFLALRDVCQRFDLEYVAALEVLPDGIPIRVTAYRSGGATIEREDEVFDLDGGGER